MEKYVFDPKARVYIQRFMQNINKNIKKEKYFTEKIF